jgi:hypothetical protein
MSQYVCSFAALSPWCSVSIVTLRPSNIEASLGLRQCLNALKAIEVSLINSLYDLSFTRIIKMIWPSASRAWELLNGVKVRLNNARSPGSDSRRHKRQAEAAFDNDTVLATECAVFGCSGQSSVDRLQDEPFGTQIVNQVLGLDNPPVKPLSSFISGTSGGTEWWLDGTASPRSPMVPHGAYSSPNIAFDAQTLPDDWMPRVPDIRPGYAFDPAVTNH